MTALIGRCLSAAHPEFHGYVLLAQRRAERTLGHNPLGGLSVIVLLALVAATVLSGAFGGEAAEDFHELIAWTLLAFIGLHVAAVVIMSVLEREKLVAAMITGKKSEERHPGGSDARHPSAIGVLGDAPRARRKRLRHPAV